MAMCFESTCFHGHIENKNRDLKGNCNQWQSCIVGNLSAQVLKSSRVFHSYITAGIK